MSCILRNPGSSLPFLQDAAIDFHLQPDDTLPQVSFRPILSSHLCLGLPYGLFPSRFPTKIVPISSLSNAYHMIRST